MKPGTGRGLTFTETFVLAYVVDVVFRSIFHFKDYLQDPALFLFSLVWSIGSSLFWTVLFRLMVPSIKRSDTFFDR